MVGQPAHSPCALEVVCSRTTCGDELFLCGGHEILGAWEVGRALKLYTQKESFPVWKLQLPASLAGEFKLLVKRLLEPKVTCNSVHRLCKAARCSDVHLRTEWQYRVGGRPESLLAFTSALRTRRADSSPLRGAGLGCACR